LRRFLLLATVLFAGLLTSVAAAHELKVFGSRLTLPEGGGKVTTYLSWGHRTPVDELMDASTVERYEIINPAGTASKLKAEGLGLQTNAIQVKDAGIYTVVANRKSGTTTYVIDNAGARQLKRGPKSDYSGEKIDFAQRSVQTGKAFIVVGKPTTDLPKALGLPLEIVPLEGPARWTAGKDNRFQVLLNGKPLSGAEVHARYVGFMPDDAWCYATESGQDGEFSIRPLQAGIWIIKVKHKTPSAEDVRKLYDFESLTTTLTLEMQP
jgi:uncharacterized GH25 family protein